MGRRFNLTVPLLDAHLDRGHADRPAIRHEGTTISYGALAALTGRVGSALRELGVEPEQRVAILLPDSPEFVATFLGAIRIGAVAVPLSTVLRPAEQAELLAHCRAVALVVDRALLDGLRPGLIGLAHLRRTIVVGGTAPDAIAFDLIRTSAPLELAPADTDEDDMAFWQYSSGTTGRPKAVVHLQHDLIAATESYGPAILDMTDDDRSYSIPKLFFSYGLGNSLAFPLRYGACAILDPGRPEPRRVFALVARERPTIFYAVPTAYAALLAAAEADAAMADLSSVRRCISAGEALPAAIFERWRARFGLEILDGIGSTEIGYICISNRPGQARPGTSGRVLPGYEAKVADADGRPVPTGEIGDLWVKGASTFAGYWNDRERTAQALRGEWVVTGDTYAVDAEGYFRYAGRTDDMLKVGGIWVSPIEVEAALAAHPAVLECAVVGRPDGDGLTKPAAFVVLTDRGREGDDLAAELVAFVAERIAPYKRPRWVHFVAELPKTATGKIQRFKLREGPVEVSA